VILAPSLGLMADVEQKTGQESAPSSGGICDLRFIYRRR
jgi:hypothetical protein